MTTRICCQHTWTTRTQCQHSQRLSRHWQDSANTLGKLWRLALVIDNVETRFSNFVIEYLCETKKLAKTVFACSWGLGGIFKAKNGLKSRDTVPLMSYLYLTISVKLLLNKKTLDIHQVLPNWPEILPKKSICFNTNIFLQCVHAIQRRH